MWQSLSSSTEDASRNQRSQTTWDLSHTYLMKFFTKSRLQSNKWVLIYDVIGRREHYCLLSMNVTLAGRKSLSLVPYIHDPVSHAPTFFVFIRNLCYTMNVETERVGHKRRGLCAGCCLRSHFRMEHNTHITLNARLAEASKNNNIHVVIFFFMLGETKIFSKQESGLLTGSSTTRIHLSKAKTKLVQNQVFWWIFSASQKQHTKNWKYFISPFLILIKQWWKCRQSKLLCLH